MIKVVAVHKESRKIVSYDCVDESGKAANLTRDELADLIRSGKVSNAKVQRYQGSNIVRLQEDLPVIKSNGEVVQREPKTTGNDRATENGNRGEVGSGRTPSIEQIKCMGQIKTNKREIVSNKILVENLFYRKCQEFGVLPTDELKEHVIKNEKEISLIGYEAFSDKYGDVKVISGLGVCFEINYKAPINKNDIRRIKAKIDKLPTEEVMIYYNWVETCVSDKILKIAKERILKLDAVISSEKLSIESEGLKKLGGK